ncbi:ferredoxin [Mycobacteroides abscessus]|uniref:ferredoxin n=1 Tax=Mycobacteroides abscessus TaxID=36809 RepID=UPI000925C62C|nr:ferredoxin [Mycobacteroides abscessus]SHQ88773.1 Ferredoxin [Mycobacteroides abscessus subsp. bolletii]SHR74205.1 Ferredoxin [Mycobacteroides abscessus subsp. bolletii]SHT17518.1 Ferredoxin [Mycobacteroides abscessus subsp. bolletii]SKG04525.1 Ferredoxin [Mycobacteroides abscessus subsp. bolletii]SKG72009.1 Ferredoxin [Mycobacteroides abscessus subsp. bolletii]
MNQPAGAANLTVDQDLCMGSGYCARSYPDLFDLGDDGIAFTRTQQLSGEQLADAQDAVAICPSSAIEVHGA